MDAGDSDFKIGGGWLGRSAANPGMRLLTSFLVLLGLYMCSFSFVLSAPSRPSPLPFYSS